jgi:hypothetical protein
MKRWQQAEGKVHAVDSPAAPHLGETFRTLCGATVTTGPQDYGYIGNQWPRPTCWDCESVWREIDHLPPLEVAQ